MPERTLRENAILATAGTAAGAMTAAAGLSVTPLYGVGVAAPANKAAYAAVNAFRAHATLGQALSAGLSAIVPGSVIAVAPGVATAAVAAAPLVAVAGAAALAGFGLFKLFEAASHD